MGIVYSVATPIGNLEDITLRALRILKEVDIIACEDTRHSAKLLHHFEITKPTVALHQHSSQGTIDKLLQSVVSGKNVALITDAGTPGISDPGQMVIAAAIKRGITVVPIPGAVAAITALQAAGIPCHEFVFLGFLPHKKGRQTLLRSIIQEARPVIVYESPHRVLKTLEALKDTPKQIIVARELTKLHEEFIRGSVQQVYEVLQHRQAIKGECVIIVYE